LNLSDQHTGSEKGSLLGVLDHTKTPMGKRLLRTWILRPLIDVSVIDARLSSVSDLISIGGDNDRIRDILSGIGDLERLAGKIGLEKLCQETL
jgi:DNA mismatch repair protein MutS